MFQKSLHLLQNSSRKRDLQIHLPIHGAFPSTSATQNVATPVQVLCLQGISPEADFKEVVSSLKRHSSFYKLESLSKFLMAYHPSKSWMKNKNSYHSIIRIRKMMLTIHSLLTKLLFSSHQFLTPRPIWRVPLPAAAWTVGQRRLDANANLDPQTAGSPWKYPEKERGKALNQSTTNFCRVVMLHHFLCPGFWHAKWLK